MPDPHTYTNDEGDVLLPWDSVRDMLERLVGQEPFSTSLALADLLYHWQREKRLTARDAATRWQWSKTRAAEFMADKFRTNSGQETDKQRTRNGENNEESPERRTGSGQETDKRRTNGGQQRKIPPIPPIKENTHPRDKRAGVDGVETNPQKRSPTKEQVQQWATTTTDPVVPPEIAWAIAESYEGKGWVDRNGNRITNWQKCLTSAYRWQLKEEKNASVKTGHSGVAKTGSADYGRRRDFGNQRFEEPDVGTSLPDVQPIRRR